MSAESVWVAADVGPLMGSTVVVTGANRGVGFALARRLVDHGATVVLACRDLERAERAGSQLLAEFPDSRVDVVVLDLASLTSVAAAVDVIGSRHGRIDVLINNAGAVFPSQAWTVDEIEQTLAVNHAGPFALSLGLRDLLAASGARGGPGRVVTVSSGGHRFARLDVDDLEFVRRRYSGWAAYGQAKLVNLLFTSEFQRRLEIAGLPVRAVAAHPGIVSSTGFGENTRVKRLLDRRAVHRVTDRFTNPIGDAVLPILRAATDPGVGGGDFVGPAGWLGISGSPVVVGMPRAALDPELGARVWEVSQRLTGLFMDGGA